MREGITKIDLNFSNSGGGHTASVSSILGSKNIQDGSEGLGGVWGELGEVSTFSHPKIQEMMENFVCTDTTTSKDPTKTALTRKYTDKVSRLLKSYIVLVRGINCGPESLEFEGPVPFFTEVINTPLKPYKRMGPIIAGSTIMAGKIYNMEAASTYEGFKMTLVYNQRELIEHLSINHELVSPKYKASPDLAQYDLKFGYTAADVKTMLSMIGITVEGMPSAQDHLFEVSGTLDSVVSSVASYYGYFYFVDPSSMSIKFINTQEAANIPIENFTESNDPDIINASYSKSRVTDKQVTTYVGTAEKKDDQSQNEREFRGKQVFFKKIEIGYLLRDLKILGSGDKDDPFWHAEISMLFGLFNQNVNNSTMNKFFAYLVHNNQRKNGQESLMEKLINRRLNFREQYKDSPFIFTVWKFLEVGALVNPAVYVDAKNARADQLTKDPAVNKNRITDKFRYLSLMKDIDTPMQLFSQSKLHELLSLYFRFAGGFYVSNAYTEYKVDRMAFKNTNRVTVIGPFNGDKKISEIPDLADLHDLLKILAKEHPAVEDYKVKQLAKLTQGNAVQVHNEYFFATRAVKRVAKDNDDNIEYEKIETNVELGGNLFKPAASHLEGFMMMGAPAAAKGATMIRNFAEQSMLNFAKLLKSPQSIPVKYDRSKTRVNNEAEEGDLEDEDDEGAKGDSAAQKMSELFDRFDLKYYGVEQPTHDMMNSLSMQGASGSTIEMKALRLSRGPQSNLSYTPASSSKTVYGLVIPQFSAVTSSISLALSGGAVQTTIAESAIKLIPPDQEIFMNRGMQALARKSYTSKRMGARQRNTLGF